MAPTRLGLKVIDQEEGAFFFFLNLSVIKSPSFFFLIYTKALFSFSVVGVIEILAKLKSVKILRDNFFFQSQ